MRATVVMIRILLALGGLAALAWGLTLTVQFAVGSAGNTRSAVAFLLGGPVAHDAIVAPVVGVVGWLISRWVGPAWRAPVRIGAAISAVLSLLAVPALWRTYAGLSNPGLDDRDYGGGLLLALAVVWVGVLVAGTIGTLRRRRTARE